jgi:beta-lactamase regulating signal transducer with metallopeptidase domain
MTPSLFLDNLLAWGAQVAVLVATAALVSRRWPHARARLAFWQGILTLSVLLPLIGPWYQPPLQAIPNIVAADTISSGFETVVAAQPRTLWTMDLLPWILVGGAVLRLAWIGAGLLRLRNIRKKAIPMSEPPSPLPGEQTWRDVQWYVSDDVTGPVTFGWRWPSVLLPARIAHLPEDARQAIIRHELIHVERKHWVFVLIGRFCGFTRPCGMRSPRSNSHVSSRWTKKWCGGHSIVTGMSRRFWPSLRIGWNRTSHRPRSFSRGATSLRASRP